MEKIGGGIGSVILIFSIFFQVAAAKVSKQNLPLLMTLGFNRIANLVTTNCNKARPMGNLTTFQVMEKMASGIPMENGLLDVKRIKPREMFLFHLNPMLIAPLNHMIN